MTTRNFSIQGPGLGSSLAAPGAAARARYGSAIPTAMAVNTANIVSAL